MLRTENEKLKEQMSRAGYRIAELKIQIETLEDRICELRRKNASLENKVEKMKCCQNCKKRGAICVSEEMKGILCDGNKWEIAE